MGMEAAEIERLIKEALPDATIEIRDLTREQQHQMVYAALKGQMGGVLHALALQTGTPEG
jgi:stress-induced morphogen